MDSTPPRPALVAGIATAAATGNTSELRSLLTTASDEGVATTLAANELVVQAAYEKAAGGKPVGERAFLQYLEACRQIRANLVTLPGGKSGHADLTWQDASAAFELCAGGGTLDAAGLGKALALCGNVKYRDVPGMGAVRAAEGFLANVEGSKDEHAVIGAGS